jgi:hypothetical protein
MVNRKSKLLRVILGISGTVLVALIVISVGGSIPPLAVFLTQVENPWASFLGLNSIFFFPPYFAMTGLISLLSRKTDGEVNSPDFMSNYYRYADESKKDWIKHLTACVVGVLNAFLMWALIGMRWS